MTTTKNTDPRGPFRTVESVESTPSEHRVRFVECDHTAQFTRHHSAPRPGERRRCFDCREASR